MVLRGFSWFCTQESYLIGSGEHMGCRGLKVCQPSARQVLSALHCPSSPVSTISFSTKGDIMAEYVAGSPSQWQSLCSRHCSILAAKQGSTWKSICRGQVSRTGCLHVDRKLGGSGPCMSQSSIRTFLLSPQSIRSRAIGQAVGTGVRCAGDL